MKQRTTVSPKRCPTRATSPFAGFRSDHLRVLGHLDLLESDVLDDRAFGSKAAATLRPIVAILGRQFATHMTAEDALLYPWLAETLPESRVSIAELSDDHVELRSLLSGIATAMTQPPARRRNEQRSSPAPWARPWAARQVGLRPDDKRSLSCCASGRDPTCFRIHCPRSSPRRLDELSPWSPKAISYEPPYARTRRSSARNLLLSDSDSFPASTPLSQ